MNSETRNQFDERAGNRKTFIAPAAILVLLMLFAGCSAVETDDRTAREWSHPASRPAAVGEESAGVERGAADADMAVIQPTEKAVKAETPAAPLAASEELKKRHDAIKELADAPGGAFPGSPPAPKAKPLSRSVAPGSPAPAASAMRAVGARPAPRVEVDPRALPSREEEIWVISKLDRDARARVASHDNDLPICSLRGHRGPDNQLVPMPLKHTEVNASIEGYLATVEVTQQFHNPFSSKIEAVYVFPLPQNSAVNEFVMTIGDRRIRGIIREKEEAKKMYEAARASGYRASLLTQERPNVFTQKVANIEPGKRIDIDLKYYHTLAWNDGWYEFVFPMVVGPRYNPAGSTDVVGSVGRGGHGASGQATEVQYLRPKERSGHDVALNVKLNAGVAVEELLSRTHAIAKIRRSESEYELALKPLDTVPNKDFVLRWRVTGSKVKSNLVTHRDDRGGYFSLMLYPPDSLKPLKRAPMEMIFVIDCSGSMNGAPIRQAKTAIERALSHLESDDTFQIIRFSNNASQLGPDPVPVTAANIRRAKSYLKGLHGSGGTQMIEGVRAALNFGHDPRRLRFVTFLTDGFIGNEADILREIQKRIGATRIFSFGVGSSPNDYLMDRMAKLGRGAVAYLNLNDSAAEIMDRFFERVSHPAMTDVTIDWGGLEVEEAYPARVPDLFVGRPVVVTGKFQGGGRQNVRIRGKLGNGEEMALEVPVNLNRAAVHQGLAAVWARRKIADLADRAVTVHNPELHDEIKTLALDYSLMSSYTAFVAVDSSARTAGNFGTTVPVAVPVPEGVKYETTVEN